MTDSVLYCIANPTAARGKRKGQVCQILSFLEQNHIATEIRWTESPRHGVAIARELAQSGVTRIASMGGDGTAFEVINGIMGSGRSQEVTLGIVPLGTGNSFLRDFDITSWQEAAWRIVRGNTQSVDLGRVIVLDHDGVEPVYFHNMIGFGLIAHACHLRHTRYPWMGDYAYHGAFFNLLFGMKSYSMQFQVEDGEKTRVCIPLAAICNSQFTGHNMRLSPRSLAQDGKLDFLYSDPLRAWELFKLFLALPSGNHIDYPKVRFHFVQSLDIQIEEIDYFMADGEVIPGKHLQIDVLPASLSLFL